MKNILISLFALSLIGCASSYKQQDIRHSKIVIYQVFTRLFGSDKENPIIDGSLESNGVGKFNDFTTTALDSIKAMGATHIWYTGVIEHASVYTVDSSEDIYKNHQGVIKGKAGSPYAIKDYYDVNSYLAVDADSRMSEFDALVERTHRAGLKMVIDFVPNHVARGYHSDAAPDGVRGLGADDDNSISFGVNNNFYYIPNTPLRPKFDTEYNSAEYYEFPAKATGNDVFSAEPHAGDWYETVKLNYGVDYQNNKAQYFEPIPDTWHKMKDILLFWASKGADAFRCDMAEMVPHEFWGWAIAEVNKNYPDIIFIAEIYNPSSYSTYIDKGGFDYLYDKVGLYDTLKSVVRGSSPAIAISKSREKIAAVQPYMLNFLENHDEQRIAWHEFASDATVGIPMMLVSTLSDNIPMMIYFGQELGEVASEETGFSQSDGRTTIFDFWTMPLYQSWRNGGLFDGAKLTDNQKKLRADYIKILKMSNSEKVFTDGSFIDLTELNSDSNSSVYTFMRYTDSEIAIVFANLSDKEVVEDYELSDDILAKLNIARNRPLRISKQLFGANLSDKEILLSDDYISVNLTPYQGIVIKLQHP